MYTVINLIAAPYLPFNNVSNLIWSIRNNENATDYGIDNYDKIVESLYLCHSGNILGEGKFGTYSIIKNINTYEKIMRTYKVYLKDLTSCLDVFEESIKLRDTLFSDEFWKYLYEYTGNDSENLFLKIFVMNLLAYFLMNLRQNNFACKLRAQLANKILLSQFNHTGKFKYCD